MKTISEAFAIALDHQNAGRLQLAEDIYRQILAQQPDHADSLHSLGLLAHQVGQHAAAAELLSQAIAVAPTCVVYYTNLAEIQRTLKQFDSAIATSQRAIELAPNDSIAHCNLGVIYCDLQRWDESIAACERSIVLRPDSAIAYNALGTSFRGKGLHAEAIEAFQKAATFNPKLTHAWNNLAITLTEQKRLSEAIDACRQAIAIAPEISEFYFNLGNALRENGQLEESLAAFERAVALKPDYAMAYCNAGAVLFKLKKLDAAQQAFQQALRIDPNCVEAYNNIANVLLELERHDEALAAYQETVARLPHLSEAHSNIGHLLVKQGKLAEGLQAIRRAFELDPRAHTEHSSFLFTLQFCTGVSSAEIAAALQEFNQTHAVPLASTIPPHDNERSPHRPLRIGFVSSELRAHVVGMNMMPVFREHDATQFEFYVYSNAKNPDVLTEEFQRHTAGWREIHGFDDPTVAQLIRDDKIDILVDLSMHMAHSRLLLFARKPAPIQVTFAAYPGSTGLSTIDYRLTDPYLDPPGMFDQYYSEESVRLPYSFWCYSPMEQGIEVSDLPALQTGVVTFGSLNNITKVNAGVIQLWGEVMRQIPNSRLITLLPKGLAQRFLFDSLAREGISADRIEFIQRLSRAEYLHTYDRIDLGLDTFPYNGHSTSLDSYWMGVPVVTLLGETVVGRAGLSQLTNLNLPEFIATTPQQYVQIATDLARDLPRLAAIRASLRPLMEASPLMDDVGFTRAIEKAFRQMWQRYCASATPSR